VNTSVDCSLVLRREEKQMTWGVEQELSYQRIAELHADAEKVRRARVSRRKRERRARARLGRLLRPGLATWANDVVGGILSPPWPSRRDTLGPSRLDPSLGR
jgi:hypothetical protein